MNIDSLRLLLRMSGFFLATDTPERGEREQRQMLKSLAETSGRIDVITKLFYGNTKTLIAEEPCKLVGDERSALDVVKDVQGRTIQRVYDLGCKAEQPRRVVPAADRKSIFLYRLALPSRNREMAPKRLPPRRSQYGLCLLLLGYWSR